MDIMITLKEWGERILDYGLVIAKRVLRRGMNT